MRVTGHRGREVQRQLLQDHPGLRAIREQEALPAGRDQRRAEGRGRIERGHERGLATVFGPVTVRRLAYRAPGRPSIYPAGAALSLPAGRHSHGLRRAAVCEAMRGSSGTAKAVIGRRCGRVAGKRQIEELVQAAAAGIGAFCARRVPVPCTSEVLLVLSADGKGIVMRPEGLRPAHPQGRRGQGRGPGRLPHPASLGGILLREPNDHAGDARDCRRAAWLAAIARVVLARGQPAVPG